MASIDINTPNSKMIINLLRKNAAKYIIDEETPIEKENTEEYLSVNTQVCPFRVREKNKSRKIELKRKPLNSQIDAVKVEIKSEKYKRIKVEYIETDVKAESKVALNPKLIIKKEKSENEENLALTSSGVNRKSTILDILKNNVAKYKDTQQDNKEIHPKKRTIDFTAGKMRNKERKLEVQDDRELSDKEFEEVKHKVEVFDDTTLKDIKPKEINIKKEYIEKTEVSDFANDIKAEITSKKYLSTIAKKKISKKSINSSVAYDINDENTNEASGIKVKKKPSGTPRNGWSNEEVSVIREAMEKFGDKLDFRILGLTLNRHKMSVRSKVRILKNGSLSSFRPFSLTEDLLLMDDAIIQLPGCPLNQVRLLDLLSLEAKLGRPGGSCTQRWDQQLNPWILQHYSGTRNLDIRRMLANYLEEHFQDIDSVDWVSVARNAQFAGHTSISLRAVFFKVLLSATKRNMPDGSLVTIQDVAVFANSRYQDGLRRRITPKLLERQKNVVEYFKQRVKEEGKVDFELYSQ